MYHYRERHFYVPDGFAAASSAEDDCGKVQHPASAGHCVVRRTLHGKTGRTRTSFCHTHVHAERMLTLAQTNFTEQSSPQIFDAFKSSIVPPDRYQTSKLLQLFVVRHLAQRLSASTTGSTDSVILNTLTPGYCRSALFRDNKFPASLFINVTGKLLARSSEQGSRTYVHAAAAGPETHGKWLDSNVIREPSSFVRSKEGKKAQARVYEELMSILEAVEPGITSNI